MGMINHTVGLTIGAGGALCGAFAAHAAWPETFGFLSGAGSAYPLQGIDVLSGITSTLATIDPLLLGGIALGATLLAKSVMKSDHPAPSAG
tara:strand:- start:267 stop:539 length:273 start_codon:yes stop_codon:yes gene_type:complete